jgi:hypothetical protein
MAKCKHSDSPDRSSWSSVDLLEFVRPALMALLFFMVLVEGLGNAPLVMFVLNGQGHFMVHASHFFSFCYLFLTNFFMP